MNRKLIVIVGTVLAGLSAYKLYCVLTGGHEDMKTNGDRRISVTCIRCGRESGGIDV